MATKGIATSARATYSICMTVTRADLSTSPDHYLHSFDGDDAVFVPMDRAAYHRSIFLDGRISAAAGGSMKVPVASLAGDGQPISWIFHIAHCGSTLLARALDRVDANLVLREPAALRQVGVAPDAAKLAVVLAMLGKRYLPGAPTVVKANVPVNFILPDIVAADADAHAIFLHCGLRDYLFAVLRSEGHRNWVRQVTDQFASRLGDMTGLSDAERAAALWLGQLRTFADAMRQMPNARSLDSEMFFGNPRPALTAAAAHLGVAMTDDDIARIVAGPLFATSAKNPSLAFDNAARLTRRASLEETLAPELDQAQIWIDQAGGGITLGRPLV
jgi:hypothetical protein